MPWTLLVTTLLISLGSFAAGPVTRPSLPVTPEQQKAITQAIEDEIYDFGYQGWDFGYVGKTIGTDEQEIRVYIEPKRKTYLRGGGDPVGYVIYKYMPFGEVLRMFWFTKDGMAVLGGNPEMGFTPEHPNYLTVYMGDDELLNDKEHWLRARFDVNLHPTAERLHEAAQRQTKRIGYSVRLDPSRRLFASGKNPACQD
ncbi:MAG TPA: hypothetical protein VGT03_06880 [Candidatus Acidoferrales bacterium]|nr:hypothetical protein [Candidatus Acidoferrales bacterium]